MPAQHPLALGNAALQAGRWSDARAAFADALKERQTAEALSGMGMALWWLGEPRASLTYLEPAYAEFRRARDLTRAAWTALWVGLTYGSDLGNEAAFGGWIARTERLLRDADPGPMHGWLSLARAYATSDLALSRQHTERALELAGSTGDLDLELAALAQLGQTLVAMGQAQEGLALIDEAMAGSFGGECSRLDTVVFTSCSMIVACELAADLERATRWCRVADGFISTYGCPFLHARCRTGYGAILVATGHWDEAERELSAAIRTSQDALPPIHAHAIARLADLRVRQGRLEEADTLLATGDEGLAAAPRAALALARGNPAVAVALLQRALNLLGESHLDAAPILDLLAQAQVAQGALEDAARTVQVLTSHAHEQGRDVAAAHASCALGRLLLARKDGNAAVAQLEQAVERFSRLGLPLETARARLDLARALAADQPSVGIVEGRRALAAFEQLGAARDADAAAAVLRSMGDSARTGPKHVGVLTKREQEVLRLVAAGLSNPEIARRLCISRKTAAHHVSSLLAKLGLRTRAEAISYAVRLDRELADTTSMRSVSEAGHLLSPDSHK